MMDIRFEDKEKVVASFMGKEVISDLPIQMGGEDTALNPFYLFLCSIGNCTGVFMKMFFKNHNIPLDNAKIHIDFEFTENDMLKKVFINLHLADSFPKDKQSALVNMLKACKVKQHLNENISFDYIIKNI